MIGIYSLAAILLCAFCSGSGFYYMSAIWRIGLFTKLSATEAKCGVCERTIQMTNRSTKGLFTHAKTHEEFANKLKEVEENKALQKNSMDRFVKIKKITHVGWKCPDILDISAMFEPDFCGPRYNSLSVHDPEIAAQLFRQQPGAVKIFLGIQKLEGQWRWLDETPLDYTNWESEEHEESVPDNSCAYINGNGNQWQSFNCSEYISGPVSQACYIKTN